MSIKDAGRMGEDPNCEVELESSEEERLRLRTMVNDLRGIIRTRRTGIARFECSDDVAM